MPECRAGNATCASTAPAIGTRTINPVRTGPGANGDFAPDQAQPFSHAHQTEAPLAVHPPRVETGPIIDDLQGRRLGTAVQLHRRAAAPLCSMMFRRVSLRDG